MSGFVRSTVVPLMLVAALGAASCAPSGDFPEYPDSISQSAHEGPWATALAPLEAAYNRNDDAETNRLILELEPQFRSTYGENSVPYAEVRTYAALRLYNHGNKEGSLDHFRDALEHYRAALGLTHPDVALALHTYADALIEARNGAAAADAEVLYREAYAIRRAALGPGHIETVAVAGAVYEAISMQADGDPASRGRADEFADGVVDAAENAPLDVLERMKLIEILADIAALNESAGNYEGAFSRYLQARRHLFKLPRVAWRLAHSIYPGLINALNTQGKTLQANIFEVEYAFVNAQGAY